jgi:hypothetical protein
MEQKISFYSPLKILKENLILPSLSKKRRPEGNNLK